MFCCSPDTLCYSGAFLFACSGAVNFGMVAEAEGMLPSASVRVLLTIIHLCTMIIFERSAFCEPAHVDATIVNQYLERRSPPACREREGVIYDGVKILLACKVKLAPAMQGKS